MAPLCICGHTAPEHSDSVGSCHEPTARCQCPEYIELCPKCTHSSQSHVKGACNRVVQQTQAICGCTHYPST